MKVKNPNKNATISQRLKWLQEHRREWIRKKPYESVVIEVVKKMAADGLYAANSCGKDVYISVCGYMEKLASRDKKFLRWAKQCRKNLPDGNEDNRGSNP